MNSQEYEERPSLEHKSLLSWWSILYRSSVWISVSRPHSILGSNRERNWRVRDTSGATQGGGGALSFREDLLLKQDQVRSPQWRWLLFLFLFLKENGSILKHNDHTIMSVTKCQKPWPDCYDMIKQSLGKSSEQFYFDDVLEECRKKKFDGASQWPLNDWISILAKRRRRQEKVSILLEFKLFQPLPAPQSSSRTFRR